jgi:hypothetical protein
LSSSFREMTIAARIARRTLMQRYHPAENQS